MNKKDLKKYKLKVLKRKRIKSKVNIFVQMYLKKQGLKDGKLQIVRKQNNQYYSPFIAKEQSDCMTAILREEEMLAKILAHLYSDTLNCGVKLEQNDYHLEMLNDAEVNSNDNIALINYCELENANSLFSDFFKEHSKLVHNHSKTVQSKWIFDDSEKIKIESHVDSVLVRREIEVTCNRCYQLYERMISRIAVYWAGVLRSDKENMLMPPLFDSKELITAVDDKVNLIKDKFEVYSNG